MQPDIRDALNILKSQLSSYSETAGLDAQVLLAHILRKPRAWALAHPETILSDDQTERLNEAAARLGSGEPLPYVLGHWEFFNLDFEVTPAVLIPRPETEILVQTALDWLKIHPGRQLAADVGTGSGCIAISLAVNHPPLRVVAIDYSASALRVAQRNIGRHHQESRIDLVQSDLLRGISPTGVQNFNLICANLPYIPENTLKTLKVGAWEPEVALLGGMDGLEVIRRLLADVPTHLARGGMLLLEIEASQGSTAAELVGNALPGASIRLIPDLAGRDRLISAQISP